MIMVKESTLPPKYNIRLIPVDYIEVIWYEGYMIEKYDVRENILMDNWLELQTFLEMLQDQRFDEKEKNRLEKAGSRYVGYTKVKIKVKWANNYDNTYRVNVGDNPDFNPYIEWIGDYLERQTPTLDFGQKVIS